MKKTCEKYSPHNYPHNYPISQANQLYTDNAYVQRLVSVIGENKRSIKEILELLNLKDRKNLIEYYITPAQNNGFVTLLYPDKPRHPRQKYVLTVKGLALLSSLNKNNSI